jgi:hypothetical protein
MNSVPTTKVRLYTADGLYVVTVELPHVEPMPQIVTWGKRHFVVREEADTNDVMYVEALCYNVVGNVTDEGEVKDLGVTGE